MVTVNYHHWLEIDGVANFCCQLVDDDYIPDGDLFLTAARLDDRVDHFAAHFLSHVHFLVFGKPNPAGLPNNQHRLTRVVDTGGNFQTKSLSRQCVICHRKFKELFEPPMRQTAGQLPYGVADGARTRDLLDHNQAFYQLNYSHHLSHSDEYPLYLTGGFR